MAKEKYPWNALKKLLSADATLTADDLTKVADVTASAAELNYTDTSAPGTTTASKVLTADANLMTQGWKRAHEAHTVDDILGAAETFSIHTNNGAAGTVKLSLPAAVVGLEFMFYVLAAQALQIDPNGTETIGLPSSGAQQAAGKYITADAAGEYVHIICAKAGQWETLGYRGTWTVEG